MQPLTGATRAGVSLSFGMLNLTVNIHSAVGEDSSRSLRTVCVGRLDEDGEMVEHAPTPIKQRYECPACQNDNRASFHKGAESSEGIVVVPPATLEKEAEAAAAFKKKIELTTHWAREVSAVLLPSGKSYYLSMKEPLRAHLETYTLLGQLLTKRPDLAFMCKLTLSSAVSLFQLTVAGEGTLLLRQMADAALIREHPRIPFVEPEAGMLEIAERVANLKVSPFVVAEHGSGKSNIIADYVAAQTPVAPATLDTNDTGSGAKILDLKSALEAMLAQAAPAPVPTTTPARARRPRKVS